MKKIFLLLALALLSSLALPSCRRGGKSCGSLPNGEFIYNIPCKTVYIHQELAGKSIMFLWLHGGVHDSTMHDIFETNHFDCCAADDSVLNYLQKKNIKAVCLFPVCHKSEIFHGVAWRDCWSDVKSMVDAYVDKGLVDPDRIYLAGSSDGGTGTWDYAEAHPEVFAVGLAMSCGRPRRTSLPMYFFNTRREMDCTAKVDTLVSEGYNIRYRHCPEYKHGGDAAECTEAFLDEYFSHVRQQ